MTANKPVSDRCWCGRPQLDSTGRCAVGHSWTGACDGVREAAS